jgi:hypothetical protein
METPGERLQRGPSVQLNDDEQRQSRTPSNGEEGEGDMAGGRGPPTHASAPSAPTNRHSNEEGKTYRQ